MKNEKILDISWSTFLKIALVIIAFYILYQIKDILVWFILALIISVLFNPAVDFLRRLKIPRVLAVSLLYIGSFGILALLVYLLAPIFVSEVQQFSQILPQYFEKVSPPLKDLGIRAFEDTETLINTLGGTLNKVAGNILNILFLIFGGIFTTIFILTCAIFLSLEGKGVERSLILLFPKRYETYVSSLWKRCQKRVSSWFLTRILSCLFVGLLSYFVFLIFKSPYPFSLGLLAGTLNFVPVVGPIITALVLFIIISLDSISKAVFLLIAFALIQLIEGNILLPLLTKKFVGLSPVLVLMSLAIGGVLWGFLGAILAVPLAGILFEFLKDFFKKRREEELSAEETDGVVL